MSMIFCRSCGKQIHETAPKCPHCGAEQRNQSNQTKEVPPEIKGWSWGAFFLNWIWAIGNKTWIGLLAIIPWIGIIVAIVLGFKGREWAWKNKEWESIEHFNRVQKKWSYWGVVIFITLATLGIIAGVGYGFYEDYSKRSKTETETGESFGLDENAPKEENQKNIAPIAVAPEYKELNVTESSVGSIFQLRQLNETIGTAINHSSRKGVVNLMESVVDDVSLTGYVSVEKAYQFGEKYIIIVSTGEQGQSCAATTYAFTYDLTQEYVSGKKAIEGCSESIITFSEGNKLIVKKEKGQSAFYDGQVKSDKATQIQSLSREENIVVQLPRGDCDMEYSDLLKQAKLSVKEIQIHGPDDADFAGYGCPYRITPKPGTQVTSGATISYRSAWEGG